jgi:hypothetical protein
LLGAETLDALADLGAAVEKVQGDTGDLGQTTERDWYFAADHLA